MALERGELEPMLVHLIAGLRQHQVEEAVRLLLDYIDVKAYRGAAAAPSAQESRGTVNGAGTADATSVGVSSGPRSRFVNAVLRSGVSDVPPCNIGRLAMVLGAIEGLPLAEANALLRVAGNAVSDYTAVGLTA